MEKTSNIRLDVLGASDGARTDVALKITSKTVTVRHHSSMAYGGLLRPILAASLIEVLEQHRVTLVPFVLQSTENTEGPQAIRSCSLCITVYGMQEAGKNVGEVFDHAGIYLQHPSSYDSTVPYRNPHYLVRPGGGYPTPISEEQVEVSIGPSLCLSTDQRLKGDVSQLIDTSAQGPSNYSKVTPSSHLRTNLKA